MRVLALSARWQHALRNGCACADGAAERAGAKCAVPPRAEVWRALRALQPGPLVPRCAPDARSPLDGLPSRPHPWPSPPRAHASRRSERAPNPRRGRDSPASRHGQARGTARSTGPAAGPTCSCSTPPPPVRPSARTAARPRWRAAVWSTGASGRHSIPYVTVYPSACCSAPADALASERATGAGGRPLHRSAVGRGRASCLAALPALRESVLRGRLLCPSQTWRVASPPFCA